MRDDISCDCHYRSTKLFYSFRKNSSSNNGVMESQNSGFLRVIQLFLNMSGQAFAQRFLKLMIGVTRRVFTLFIKHSDLQLSGMDVRMYSATQVLPQEIWRNVLERLSNTDLIVSTLVCKTFKAEGEVVLKKQTKLGIFISDKRYIFKCYHPDHHVPDNRTLVIKDIRQLQAVKTLMPLIKILEIQPNDYLDIQCILTSFVNLECLAVNGQILCEDSTQVFPALKHLTVFDFCYDSNLYSLPSLESFDVFAFRGLFPYLLESWFQENTGIPLKRIRVCYLDMLMSLPSSLEDITSTLGCMPYSRQFKPLFPKLSRFSSDIIKWGNITREFIDFLKDHRTTLKELSLGFALFDDEHEHDLFREVLQSLGDELHFILNIKHTENNLLFFFILRCQLKCRVPNLKLELKAEVRDFNELLFVLNEMPQQTRTVKLRVTGETEIEPLFCRMIIMCVIKSELITTSIKFDAQVVDKEAWVSAAHECQDTHDLSVQDIRGQKIRVVISKKTLS